MPSFEDIKMHLRRPVRIALALLIFALFFMMLAQKPWDEISTKNQNGTVEYVNNPWVLSCQGKIIDSQLELPAFRKLEKGKLYKVSTQLNYDGKKDQKPYGYLHVDHMYCRVVFEGNVLFSYMPEDAPELNGIKSPGYIYKAFPLPNDCKGKTLEVEFLPPLDAAVEYGLPDLVFGDYASSLNMAVQKDIPLNVIAILCFLLGAASVLFSTIVLEKGRYREGIWIGIFALLFSLYILTESVFNYYVLANPYYTYLLNYIPFSLMPLSLMGFMRERFEVKRKKICSLAMAVEAAFFAAEMYLHFNAIVDMREILPFIHLIYFSQIVIISVLLMVKPRKKRQNVLILQLLPVIAGMVIDALVYWNHWDIGGNDATFTICGVLVFLLIELAYVWRSSVNIYAESARSKLYREMAYVDELTQAGNRRAFDEEIKSILDGERSFNSMIVVSADVNNLKRINDHYGHAAGDKLIQNAAKVMIETVQDRGRVFRTGGDEFSAFLYNTEVKHFETMLNKAQKKADQFSEENEFNLSYALGYVQIFDNKILEAVRAADQKMYENKILSKQSRESCEEGAAPAK